MKTEDFKIDLEEKCLESARSCFEYRFDSAAGRAAFLSGYFQSEYPFLSELFDFISSGKDPDDKEIPF